MVKTLSWKNIVICLISLTLVLSLSNYLCSRQRSALLGEYYWFTISSCADAFESLATALGDRIAPGGKGHDEVVVATAQVSKLLPQISRLSRLSRGRENIGDIGEYAGFFSLLLDFAESTDYPDDVQVILTDAASVIRRAYTVRPKDMDDLVRKVFRDMQLRFSDVP